MKKIIFLVFATILMLNVYSQNFPKNYFRSPVGIPIRLSGNFAELRSNHFHSGIDIKTGGRIGLRIRATADGYISRIKISPTGYGKVLYIIHPKGYTTVYAHLNKYNKKIEKFVKKKQYEQNKYNIILYPDSVLFPVKKGEIIGFSGNSGSSAGPHLHFEIRKTETETPLNGLLFGFNIPDKVKPQIYNLAVHPLNDSSSVNGKNEIKRYEVKSKNGEYYIDEKIKVWGETGFSFKAQDFMNESKNRLGIYSINLFLNNKKIYSFKADEFSFYESRYINSLIDFAEYKTARRRFRKLYTEPGAVLSMHKNNTGIIKFRKSGKHYLKLVIQDESGNKSVLSFKVICRKVRKKFRDKNLSEKYETFYYDKDNYFIKDNLRLTVPKGSLYDNIKFEYKENPSAYKLFSKIYQIHNQLVPVHNPIIISINAENVPKKFKEKALIVKVSERNKIYSLGGKYINGFITCKTRTFGKFALATDITPPKIIPYKFKNNQNLSGSSKINFKISDDLSGINNYNASIDGKKIIFSYDKKKKLLTYYFDENIEYKKKHELILNVFDKKNNQAVLKINFFK